MNVHQEVLIVLFVLFKRWWNAAIFNSFKLQTRSPVFMSRFFRVGKFAFVNASNQAFIVDLMN